MDREKQEFMEKVKPYTDQLLSVARHDLDYHQARGDIQEGDLSAEEVVGETFIAVFDGRAKVPPSVPLRTWLFRLEERVLHRLIGKEEKNRRKWAFSMEEPVPDLPAPFTDDVFWDWYQPDDRDRWEDILLGFEPVSENLIEKGEEASAQLEPLERRAWLLYERFGFSVPDVAKVVDLSPSQVARAVRDAGEKLRELLREEEG